MASAGRRRGRASSDADLSRPGLPSSTGRPTGTRRTAAIEAAEALTREEEYLLSVFRLYRERAEAAAGSAASPSAASPKLPARRSPSPVPPRGKTALSSAHAKPGGPGAAEDKSAAAGGAVEPAPTDALARTKMILMEKKRKAAAAGLSRVGLAASSAEAGVIRKAKYNKVAGTMSTAASAMFDPVKYPAAGLLLTEAYRSFEEGDKHDQDRAYKRVEPLVRRLTNFGLGDASRPQSQETLVMRVTVPAHSPSWGINICPNEHKDFSEVLFHLNPRRRFVAMNNRDGNIWGQQEKHNVAKWPDLFNVSITVAVQIDKDGFHVAIDGKYCASFAHRRKLQPEETELTLQVMSADDYQTVLPIIVHEVWWGHKQRMPGLPPSEGERKERQAARAAENWRASENDEKNVDLHVGNLPPMPAPDKQEAVRKRLLDMFQSYGAIQVRVFHREKNFGFVKFRDHAGAEKALAELAGAEVQGRTIRLSKAAGPSRG